MTPEVPGQTGVTGEGGERGWEVGEVRNSDDD